MKMHKSVRLSITDYMIKEMQMEFIKWSKIPRLSRDMVVTEKIDGTNAQICIEHQALVPGWENDEHAIDCGQYVMYAGSRKRWLTLQKDNHCFFQWAVRNKNDLLKLGEGRHYGEWWGAGIQRKYGQTGKRFSLFNTSRWNEDTLPECCDVVPTLYEGAFNTKHVSELVSQLERFGSHAAPGFMNPEGVVVFHVASNSMFKKTIKNDEQHKGGTIE
jgi:hypothetical protein